MSRLIKIKERHIKYKYKYIKGKITFYLPEVSTHLHFCLQSLKCDTLPSPQTFKLWQFDYFDIFFPKMPLSHFLFFYFFEKKKRNMLRWPNHPSIFLSFFFFFFFFWFFVFFCFRIFFKKQNKICDRVILGKKKRSKWLNCHNLKVWEGKMLHFKLWRQK